MSTLPPVRPAYGWIHRLRLPLVRRGYDRVAVDEFARSAQAEIKELRDSYETLAGHCSRLQAAPSVAPEPAVPDFSGLGGRARELLRIAEEVVGGATAEADQLQASARWQAEAVRAEAVRAEAETNARAALESAWLQADSVAAEAERDALHSRQQTAADREKVLAELTTQTEDLRGRIEQTLADSTRMHTDSAARLSAQAEQAGQVRAASLAEAGRLRSEAEVEAEQLVARARQQAATVEERSRQEFAWRRRHLRQEQELLTRRKQAMLSQLASLSALAVETAEGMPEVPELTLDESERQEPTQPVSSSARSPDAT